MAQSKAPELADRRRPSLVIGRDKYLLRETQRIREAIEASPPSRCSAARNIYVVSLATGQAFPASCKRWTCPTCSDLNRQLAFWVIEEGLCLAFVEGIKARYLVLTSPPEGMDPGGLRKSWNRLRGYLERGGHYDSYAVTVEVKSGRPHLNVLTVGGRSIPQSRLCEIASRVGFGRIASIKSVTPGQKNAERLARYLVKGAVEAVQWARLHQVRSFRPIRSSREWRPFGLTAAGRTRREALGLPPVDGPFIRLRLGSRRLKVIGSEVADPLGALR